MHVEETPNHAATIHRLQPLRLLLAANDRRFARVTSFLLARRGYDVAHCVADDVLDMTVRERADVVLLQADSSRAVTARVVAALCALPNSPGLVLVTDTETIAHWDWAHTVQKWTPLEALIAEIEAASLRRVGSELREVEQ